MATFERTRFGPVGEAVKEWGWGRYAPIYAAGIIVGVAIGFGVASWHSESPSAPDHVAAAAAPATVPVFFEDLPARSIPAVNAGTATTSDLPLEYYPQMDAVEVAAAPVEPAAPEAIAPAAAPVRPAAPAAPAPAAPAAEAPAAPAAAPEPPAAPPAPEAAGKPNFYVPTVSGGAARSTELQLLQLINAERASAGLSPYALDGGLTKIARTRSQQMIDQGYFGHRDPYGYSMYVELLAYFGFTTYAWAGENLAMNNWPVETSANEAIRGLMNSPTHRANILAGDFSRIGVGEVSDGQGRHYFTMIFLS